MVSALIGCAPAAARRRRRPLTRGAPLAQHRHSRTLPGTRPSGMQMTMATKIAPSTKFQRSI